MNDFVISAFYKFVALPDFEALHQPLLNQCKARKIKGTILLAPEGMNGTIAGSRQAIDRLLEYIRQDERFRDIETKESAADFMPFHRIKVKLKKEIVTLRQDGIDPSTEVGEYVAPKEWNTLIQEDDVTLIDTRNHFEVAIGSFEGAIDPNTTSFTEFVEFVETHLDPTTNKRVAMFCTGGIRCEKATAYLLQQGFEHVYHLRGGILKYLEEVPADQSLWHGECFVFDQRVTVDHDLQPGSYILCHACWHPLAPVDLASAEFEEGVSCPFCIDSISEKKLASLRERQLQVKLAEKRGEKHIGRIPNRERG